MAGNGLSRISTTSKLMFSDLGRHALANIENATNLTAYRNVSNEYKKFQQLPQQTIGRNNMTKGIIEQPFTGFEHTYLKGNSYLRLDQLVETIHEEVLTSLLSNYLLAIFCTKDTLKAVIILNNQFKEKIQLQQLC